MKNKSIGKLEYNANKQGWAKYFIPLYLIEHRFVFIFDCGLYLNTFAHISQIF